MSTDLNSAKRTNVTGSIISFFLILGMNFFNDYFFQEITTWSSSKVIWYVASSLIIAGLVYYLGLRHIRKISKS